MNSSQVKEVSEVKTGFLITTEHLVSGWLLCTDMLASSRRRSGTRNLLLPRFYRRYSHFLCSDPQLFTFRGNFLVPTYAGGRS